MQVWAVDPISLATVTDYANDLYWKPAENTAAAKEMAEDDPRKNLSEKILTDGKTLIQSKTGNPGIALGIHVSIGNERQRDGSYRPRYGWFMPENDVTLTVVPVSSQGKIAEPREQIFPVVNEVQTGIYEVDHNRIYIPLKEGQRFLRLDEAPLYDLNAEPDGQGRYPVIGTTPARVTKILVRAKQGVSANSLRAQVETAYASFSKRINADPTRNASMPDYVNVLTWEQQLRDLIAPVEKEREMMRVLFSLIYLVCAGLILSIFWSIVVEKTRDIGILRSVGASRLGVMWIFLRYGLVIGVWQTCDARRNDDITNDLPPRILEHVQKSGHDRNNCDNHCNTHRDRCDGNEWDQSGSQVAIGKESGVQSAPLFHDLTSPCDRRTTDWDFGDDSKVRTG